MRMHALCSLEISNAVRKATLLTVATVKWPTIVTNYFDLITTINCYI